MKEQNRRGNNQQEPHHLGKALIPIEIGPLLMRRFHDNHPPGEIGFGFRASS